MRFRNRNTHSRHRITIRSGVIKLTVKYAYLAENSCEEGRSVRAKRIAVFEHGIKTNLYVEHESTSYPITCRSLHSPGTVEYTR